MGSYFDIPGIIDVQQNYLVDLSKNYYNNPIDVAIGVDDLQKGLSNVSSSYIRADKSSSAVLTEQERMREIVQTEQKRLTDKQNLIKQMEQENKRKTLLNDSYRKKKGAIFKNNDCHYNSVMYFHSNNVDWTFYWNTRRIFEFIIYFRYCCGWNYML